jgi:hypothetical protein
MTPIYDDLMRELEIIIKSAEIDAPVAPAEAD